MCYVLSINSFIQKDKRMPITSKVTSKGQVVIPKKIRDKFGIFPFTSVQWIEKEGGIFLVPESDDPLISARGMLKGTGLLKAYLEEKQEEKDKEDAGIDGRR